MSKIPAFFLGLAALVCVVGTWSHLADGPGQAKPSIQNRAWAERMPKHDKDVVSWFVPMQTGSKRFGVMQRSSRYWFSGERFVWSAKDKTITLTFQQSDTRVQLGARAYACDKNGFDYCLDLSRGGKRTTLYSKKAWRVPGGGATDLPGFDTTAAAGDCVACRDAIPGALAPLFQ